MQNGSVNKYYLDFTALTNRVHIKPLEALLNCFIIGLKLDIQQDVVSQYPTRLFRAVTLAKLYEEKYTTSFAHLFMSNLNKTALPYSNSSISHRTIPKSNFSPLLPTPNVLPTETMVKKNKWC